MRTRRRDTLHPQKRSHGPTVETHSHDSLSAPHPSLPGPCIGSRGDRGSSGNPMEIDAQSVLTSKPCSANRSSRIGAALIRLLDPPTSTDILPGTAALPAPTGRPLGCLVSGHR